MLSIRKRNLFLSKSISHLCGFYTGALKGGNSRHFKVTPHVLRTSTVTYLKQQGDIMKVTGQASAAMVCAYDKETNATERVQLLS